MRSDFKKFLRSYGRPKAPTDIWQKPFDFDARHYARLCAIKDDDPDPGDLIDYAHDINYTEVQENLFAHLLPLCLLAWRTDLFANHNSKYCGYREYFATAIASRWDYLSGRLLVQQRAKAAEGFMRDCILDKIDCENALSHDGPWLSAYAWVGALGTYAVAFPSLGELWTRWWGFETAGHTIGGLQYISSLMYEERDNPIFTPWTPTEGGGPLWPWETEGFIYDQGWNAANVEFLRKTLTLDYVHDALERAVRALDGKIHSNVPTEMLGDFELQKELLSGRITYLLQYLAGPLSDAPILWPGDDWRTRR